MTHRACIDIGGTKIAVSIAPSGQDRPIARQTAPTIKSGKQPVLAQQILQLLDLACLDAQVPPDTVTTAGVSSCGPFVADSQGRIELAAPNICGGLSPDGGGPDNDWTRIPLQAPLASRFARLRIENDCIAALEAERRWGALRGLDHCAYVTWSTGIGMGLCVDGRALRGKNGNAGHGGHMIVSDDPDADRAPLCGCGNRGDVEALASGSHFAAVAGLDAPALAQQALAGDATARQHIERMCVILGRAIYNVVTTLDLQRVAIGGSVFWGLADLALPLLRREIEGRIPALTQACSLVPAGLGRDVADWGALALATLALQPGAAQGPT